MHHDDSYHWPWHYAFVPFFFFFYNSHPNFGSGLTKYEDKKHDPVPGAERQHQNPSSTMAPHKISLLGSDSFLAHLSDMMNLD